MTALRPLIPEHRKRSLRLGHDKPYASSFHYRQDQERMSQRGCLPIACLPGGQPVLTQLRAIEILLRKSIPDLAAAEIKSEQTYRYVVELPPVLSREEWQRKYGQNRGFGNEPPKNLQ